MESINVRTKVVNGKIDKQEYIEKCFKNFEGKEIDISIKKHRDNRSTTQNRYYWAYLKIISDETGDTSKDLHEFLKRKILPPVFITVLGQEIKIPSSTTKLDKFQFTEYINKIEILTGIPSPNPDDLYI